MSYFTLSILPLLLTAVYNFTILAVLRASRWESQDEELENLTTKTVLTKEATRVMIWIVCIVPPFSLIVLCALIQDTIVEVKSKRKLSMLLHSAILAIVWGLLLLVIWNGIKLEIGAPSGPFYVQFHIKPLKRFF